MSYHLLERMLEISGQMVVTRELQPLLQLAVREALALVGAEYGYLILLDENDGTYSFPVHLKHDGTAIKMPHKQISHSILHAVLASTEGIIIEDALNDPERNDSESICELGVRSVLCVPLLTPDQVLGAIYLENRSLCNKFNAQQLKPLQFFANQAAVSIENSLLITHLEKHVKQRTMELERSWNESIEANRIRNELLSNVVHDIRAPLGIVMGTLSLMENQLLGHLTEEQQEWVAKALEASRHMKQLTADLLDLSKMEARYLSLNCKETDIPEFLHYVHDMALGLPWSTQVTFYLEIAPKPFPKVDADHVRLRQILFNLLSNALKFTKKGKVVLYARPMSNAQGVLIGVSDTGNGIPSDKLEIIFERFYQHDSDKVRREQGNGLGLAICKELVQMHGGHIWAQANSHGGTDILFTLPAKMSHVEEVSTHE